MNQAEVIEVLDQIVALTAKLPRIRVALNIDAARTISALATEMKQALPRKLEQLQSDLAKAEQYTKTKDADLLWADNRIDNIRRELAEFGVK